MSVQDKPYAVTEEGEVIRVVLHDPSAIVRCSLAELFDQLRQYAPTTDDWVGASGTLSAEFLVDSDRGTRRFVSEAVSSAFTPRSQSTCWKDW